MDKKNNKRHCMVVFAHYPAGETRVQRQAEALIKHGFEVDVICLRTMKSETQPAEETIGQGHHVYRLPVTRSYGNIGFIKQFLEYLAFFIRAMFMLIRLYPHRRYGAVQIHNLPDFLVFAAWYPKLRGTRLILDLHDLMPEFYAGRTGQDMNSGLVRLMTWQEQLSCRFANHVITVTELWRQTLIDRGVPADKISVVMNVADDRVFKPNTNGLVPKDEETFHLFYHGAIVPRYGIDLILQAMARLKEQIPALRFTIHGSDNDYMQTLVRLADQLGLSDRVHFSSNFCPMSELPNLIRTADVGLVSYRPNIFTDGILPTKLMEYVALGIPVIAARTSAIESYFDEGMVEFFTPENVDELTACILKLYQNPSHRKALTQNANKFNEGYNWTKLSTEYADLVEHLGTSKI